MIKWSGKRKKPEECAYLFAGGEERGGGRKAGGGRQKEKICLPGMRI